MNIWSVHVLSLQYTSNGIDYSNSIWRENSSKMNNVWKGSFETTAIHLFLGCTPSHCLMFTTAQLCAELFVKYSQAFIFLSALPLLTYSELDCTWGGRTVPGKGASASLAAQYNFAVRSPCVACTFNAIWNEWKTVFYISKQKLGVRN